MPNGKVHTYATVALALASIPATDLPLTMGVLSGLALSPDADVDHGFIGMAHLRRVWFIGPALSGLWRLFWWPYSKIVPHRSHISHSIFFGTALRVGYLLLPVLAINMMGVPLHLPAGFGHWFIGLCLSDALHIVMDHVVKTKKKRPIVRDVSDEMI